MANTAPPKKVIPSEVEGSGLDSSASLRAARNDGRGRKSGWSPERRAKHAAAIKIWAPWAKSTGPRTQIGKQTSSMNALKHGCRTRINGLVNAALTRHGRFLTSVQAYVRLKKRQPTNELLKTLEKYLAIECVRSGDMLCVALSFNALLQKVIKNRANENG